MNESEVVNEFSEVSVLQVKFKVLLGLLGKVAGDNEGEWSLECASCYGSYIIVEHDEEGGRRYPLMSFRLKGSEMEAALDMAIAIKCLGRVSSLY